MSSSSSTDDNLTEVPGFIQQQEYSEDEPRLRKKNLRNQRQIKSNNNDINY